MKYWTLGCLVYLFLAFNIHALDLNIASQTCTNSKSRVELFPTAQAQIAGLFELSAAGEDGIGCGAPHTHILPAYEAVNWALQRINQDSGLINNQPVTDSYVPGIKIGMKVYDTCTQSEIAIRSLLDFFPNYVSNSRTCAADNNKVFLGAIGAQFSGISSDVAKWLAKYKTPQVSFASSVTSLSDTIKYPYFMRTIPPDSLQVKVIIDTLKTLKWTKSVIVYTDSIYGQYGYSSLLKLGDENKICFPQAFKVKSDEKDQATLKAIVNQLVQSSVQTVVFYGEYTPAIEMMKAAQTVTGAGALQWLFSDSVGSESSFGKINNYVRGYMSVSPSARRSAEFEDYFVKLIPGDTNLKTTNPWYDEWWMEVNKCKPKTLTVTYEPYASLPPCDVPTETERRKSYIQNQYVVSAVDSVFTYANALKRARAAKCPGQAKGMCTALAQMTTEDFYKNYMMTTDLTFTNVERIPTWATYQSPPYYFAHILAFDNNGDPTNVTYEVWNFNSVSGTYKIQRVGSYSSGINLYSLNTNQIRLYDTSRTTALTTLPVSECPQPNGCSFCLTSQTRTKFFVQPGDIHLTGIFSIHDNINGFICSAIRSEGTQLLEAFVFAMKNIKTKFPGILNGVTLGGIGFDDCMSETVGSGLVASYQSGLTQITSQSGKSIEANTVQGYVASQTTPLTISVLNILNRLRLSQVSYGGSGTSLSDGNKYPYHLSTAPSDTKQIKAMVATLLKIGWNYVQVVKSPIPYERQMAEDFLREADANGICVTAEYEAITDGDYAVILSKLLTRPNGRVVVTFMNAKHVFEMFKAVQAASLSPAKELLFFGSRSWGANGMIAVNGVEDVAIGSLVMNIKHPSITQFEAYLKNINVETYLINPWFKEWYQYMLSCYIDASGQSKYPKPCAKNADITSSPKFKTDPLIPSVMNAVYAIGKGIDETLKQYCGNTYNGICNTFLTAADKTETLIKKIEAVSFTDDTNNAFKFEGRNAAAEYEILNYQGQASGYVKIGTYSTSDTLTLTTTSMKWKNSAIGSTCTSNTDPLCKICISKFQTKFLYIPGDFLIGGMFNVHKRGVTAFSCGDLKSLNGFQYTEAMAYAVDQINNGNGPTKLNGVTLGAVGLDACSSQYLQGNLLSNIQAGTLKLKKDLVTVNENNIGAWMTYGSENTEKAQEILRQFSLPQVSPSATAYELANSQAYPTLFRAVPPDNNQASGMAKFVREMKWSCVMVINEPTVGGRSAAKAFRTEATNQKICISQCYELGTDGSAEQIVGKLAKITATKIVMVFAEGGGYIESLLAAKAKNATSKDLVFFGSAGWGDIKSIIKGNTAAAENAITFNIRSPFLQGFDDYLKSKSVNTYTRNPWFKEWYQFTFQCNLPGSSKYTTTCDTTKSLVDAPDYQQENYLISTINSVNAIAAAIHATLVEVCGASYNGLCPQFQGQLDTKAKLIANLNKVNIKYPVGTEDFTFLNKGGNQGYQVYQIQSAVYVERATYIKLELRVPDITFKSKYLQTPSLCSPCVECPSLQGENIQEKFTYVPGDILIAGLFNVHNRGVQPFTCGSIAERYGFQLVEAFNFAIRQVNLKSGMFTKILPGVTIGGIGLDSCQSAIRASALVSDITSGVIKLIKNSVQVDPKNIVAYVGDLRTSSTVQVAEVLTVMGIPQISYGASGVILNNRKRFPYFFRTVPGDDKLARAMISFLKKWKFNNVQLVYTSDVYGSAASVEFVKVAKANGICIAQTLTFNENGTISEQAANVVVNRLLNRPNATVVITYITTDDINTFLKAVSKNTRAKNAFFFVGSEAWGNDPVVIRDIGNTVQNTVTFNIETADIPEFDDYLSTKYPTTDTENPWLAEYFQYMFQCTLPGNTFSYPTTCTNTNQGISRSPRYKQDPYTLYVINAVYSLALGLDKTLKFICGENYNGVCDDFRSSGERRLDAFKYLQQVNFTDATKQPFYYEGRESNRGYHIYKLQGSNFNNQGSPSQYSYDQIGSYNDTYKLKLAVTYDPNWDSSCKGNDCDICPYIQPRLSRYMQKKYVGQRNNDLNIAGFFSVHEPGTNIYKCGAIDLNRGFQRLLAFFFTIDYINQNKKLKLDATAKFGGLIVDICGNDDQLRQDLASYLDTKGLCNYVSYDQLVLPQTVVSYLVPGSTFSIVAGKYFKPNRITYISPSSTSVVLSNKNLYPTFLRPVPPDNLQARAMADILMELQWVYFFALNSDNAYGNDGMNALLKLVDSADNKLCVGHRAVIPMDATLDKIKEIVKDMDDKAYGKVVVLFLEHQHVKMVLQACKELALFGRFIFLGSETWGGDTTVSNGYEDIARGSITLQLTSYPIPSFIKWVTDLSYSNKRGIPDDWFDEFWQMLFKCRIDDSIVPQKQYLAQCTKQETIKSTMFQWDPFLLQVMVSTYISAQGVSNIPECKNLAIDDCLWRLRYDIRNNYLFNNIRDAQWQVFPDELGSNSYQFKFTEGGYGDIGYQILNLRPESGVFVYKRIGFWMEKLEMEKSKYISFSATGAKLSSPIKSFCPLSVKCGCPGAVKGYLTDVENIKAAPDKYDMFTHVWAVVIAALTAIGLLATICIFFYLLCFYPIRGGTTVLGFMILVGLMLVYLQNFAFLFHPCEAVCGIRQFCLGLSYAVVFSAMFVKVLNTWRIDTYDDCAQASYKRLTHPCGLFLIALGLTFIQVAIASEWLILQPPNSELVVYEFQFWPRCTPSDMHNIGLVLSCLYVMFLMIITTIFCGLTWHCEENNQESRWLLVGTCFVEGIWFVWCIISTATGFKYRDGAIALGNFLSATALLLCIFIRKIILMRRYKHQEEIIKKEPIYMNDTYQNDNDQFDDLQVDKEKQ